MTDKIRKNRMVLRIASQVAAGLFCCFSLSGCVLAVVGAAAAGGTLAVNSDDLGVTDSKPAPAPARQAYATPTPAPAYQAPPEPEPVDEAPTQLAPPMGSGSAIHAQQLDAPTPLH